MSVFSVSARLHISVTQNQTGSRIITRTFHYWIFVDIRHLWIELKRGECKKTYVLRYKLCEIREIYLNMMQLIFCYKLPCML